MTKNFIVILGVMLLVTTVFTVFTRATPKSFASTVKLVETGIDSTEYRELYNKYIEAKAEQATSEAYNIGLINAFHDLFRTRYTPKSMMKRLRKINDAHHLNMEMQFTYDKQQIRGKITDRGVFLYHKEGFSDVYDPNKVLGPFWKEQDFITTLTVN